jgi:hypothetical protein
MDEVQDVTVVELKAMCAAVVSQRATVDAAQEIADKLSAECKGMEAKLVELMTKLDMKSFKDSGITFTRVDKMSINIPKGSARDEFFAYLKEIGHFEALISVNSQTLNSWWKEEDAKAKSKGEPYAMIPGLDMPTTRSILSVTKK